MPNQYFIRRDRKVKGPFNIEKIRRLVEVKKIKSEDELSTSANGPWVFIYHSINTLYPDTSKLTDSAVEASDNEDVLEAIVVSDSMVELDNKTSSGRVKTRGEKNVESFRVKKKLLGGYKVVYRCPHCYETLTSQESEIRDEEQCPECEMSFRISDSAASRIELLRAKKEVEKTIIDKKSTQFKPIDDYDYGSKKEDENDLTPTNYIGIIIAITILFSFIFGSNEKGSTGSNTKSNNYSSSSYDSSSPYAPSPQTRREIDRMSGTAAEKSAAKDAVRRFNEAAAKRGERPTGL